MSNKKNEIENFKTVLNKPEVKEKIADFADAMLFDIDYFLDSDNKETLLERAMYAYTANSFACREEKPLSPRHLAASYSEMNKFRAMFQAIGSDIKYMDINDLGRMSFFVSDDNEMVKNPFADEPALKFEADGTIIDHGFFAYTMIGNLQMLNDIMTFVGELKQLVARFECPDDLIKALLRAGNADYDILNLISRYVPCTFPDGSDNSQIRITMLMMNIDPDFDSAPAVELADFI